MLVPMQWSRVVGSVFATIVLLFLLKGYIDHRANAQTPPAKFVHPKPTPADVCEPSLLAPIAQLDVPEPNTVSAVASTALLPLTTISEVLQASDAKSSPPVTSPKSRPSNYGLPAFAVDNTSQHSTVLDNSLPGKDPVSSSSSLRKAIVMGRTSSEDTDWVEQELPDWERSIYTVDLSEDEVSPTGLRTTMNKANEAIPYLTYIIEQYNSFPEIAVFLHAHRGWPRAWHTDAPDNDAVNMLRGLNLSVVEQRGFVNLRCTRFPGCPDEIQLNRFPVDEEKTAEIAYPFVFGEFFNMTVEEVRQQVPIVAAPCCAQFAVTRAQLLQRPKSDYERWLKLIEDSEVESHVLGTVLEYMWHIIFGQDPVHCEQEQVCRAALYGYDDPRGRRNRKKLA